MEGTNPMAKEFTPSMDLLALDVAIEAKSGNINFSLHHIAHTIRQVRSQSFILVFVLPGGPIETCCLFWSHHLADTIL